MPPKLYNLPGPQVEPAAALWGNNPQSPRVVSIPELTAITDDPNNASYFPPYPDTEATKQEIEELVQLAALRDDPNAIAGIGRSKISVFLQRRPQPLGAIYNLERDVTKPAILTGRELARWFEQETPGLAHQHALHYLFNPEDGPARGWSPPRQAWVWAALNVTVYSALLAAWHYKWCSGRNDERVSYRPRPWEFDSSDPKRVTVLYDNFVNQNHSGDDGPKTEPMPTPGTPRHPAYPSGHSTYSGAASELLTWFFPNFKEAFDDLADNGGMARLWAGIHYRSDHERGLQLGRTAAKLVIKQLEQDSPGRFPSDPLVHPPVPGELCGDGGITRND